MGAEDTITQAELAEALDGLRITRTGADLGLFVGDPQRFAGALFDRARRNREPEYEPGVVYLDGCGLPLRYTVSGGWEAFGSVGEHTHDFPLRPLRKLVPEGSPLAAGERDLIHADLGKLLEAVGLGDYARPYSSHQVMQECIAEVIKLKGGSDGS